VRGCERDGGSATRRGAAPDATAQTAQGRTHPIHEGRRDHAAPDDWRRRVANVDHHQRVGLLRRHISVRATHGDVTCIQHKGRRDHAAPDDWRCRVTNVDHHQRVGKTSRHVSERAAHNDAICLRVHSTRGRASESARELQQAGPVDASSMDGVGACRGTRGQPRSRLRGSRT
jgi:hypothetical protein